jgi:hypothetical protein
MFFKSPSRGNRTCAPHLNPQSDILDNYLNFSREIGGGRREGVGINYFPFKITAAA